MGFPNAVQHTDPGTNPESYMADRSVVNIYPTMTPGYVVESRLPMFYKIDHQLVDVKKENYLQSGDIRTRGGHKF